MALGDYAVGDSTAKVVNSEQITTTLYAIDTDTSW